MSTFSISAESKEQRKRAGTLMLIFSLVLVIGSLWMMFGPIANVINYFVGLPALFFGGKLLWETRNAVFSNQKLTISDSEVEISGNLNQKENKVFAWNEVENAEIFNTPIRKHIQLTTKSGNKLVIADIFQKFDEITILVENQLEKYGLKLVDGNGPPLS